MNILEVTFNNPIGYAELEGLKVEIEITQNYDFLIVDPGNHDFVSLDVIKFFRGQFQSVKGQLLKLKKPI